MQQVFLSEVQTSPTPGVLEITPPAGPHKILQTGKEAIPPLTSFSSDLLSFFVFEKFVFILYIFGNHKYSHSKTTNNQILTKKTRNLIDIKISGTIIKPLSRTGSL